MAKKATSKRAKTATATHTAVKATVGQKVTVAVGLLLAFGAVAAGFATLPGRTGLQVIDSSPNEGEKTHHYSEESVELIDFKLKPRANDNVFVNELSLYMKPRVKNLAGNLMYTYNNFQLWADGMQVGWAVVQPDITKKGMVVDFMDIGLEFSPTTTPQLSITANVSGPNPLSEELYGIPIHFSVDAKSVKANVKKVVGKSVSYPTYLKLQPPKVTFAYDSPEGAVTMDAEQTVARVGIEVPANEQNSAAHIKDFAFVIDSDIDALKYATTTVVARLYQNYVQNFSLIQEVTLSPQDLAGPKNVIKFDDFSDFYTGSMVVDAGTTDYLTLTLSTAYMQPKMNESFCVYIYPNNEWHDDYSGIKDKMDITDEVKCLQF